MLATVRDGEGWDTWALIVVEDGEQRDTWALVMHHGRGWGAAGHIVISHASW